MAACLFRVESIARAGVSRSALRQRCSQLGSNRSFSHTVWEDLLGRKIDPAVAEKLEQGLLEYRNLKWAPTWLPLLPNSSYWLPSQEDTVKELQSFMQRAQLSEQTNYSMPMSPTAWKAKTRSSVTTLPWFETVSPVDKELFYIAEEEVSDMEEDEEGDSDDDNSS